MPAADGTTPPENPSPELLRLQSELKALKKNHKPPLSFRDIEKEGFYSYTAFFRATSGPKHATDAVVDEFVRVCGGDQDYFKQLWVAAAQTSSVDVTDPTTNPAPNDQGQHPADDEDAPLGESAGPGGDAGDSESKAEQSTKEQSSQTDTPVEPAVVRSDHSDGEPPSPSTAADAGAHSATGSSSGSDRAHQEEPPSTPAGDPPGTPEPEQPVDHDDEQPAGDDKQPRRPTSLVVVIALLLAMAIALAVVVVVARPPDTTRTPGPDDRSASQAPDPTSPAPDYCPPPTDRQIAGIFGAQCIGLVDKTSVPTTFGAASPLDTIQKQNDALIDSQQRAVSLAYFIPLPAAPSSYSDELVHELEGVALAQQRANERNNVGGDQPKIRVLIFNTGQDGQFTPQAMTKFDEENNRGPRIVAAAGFGQSLPANISLMDSLIRRSIPVFPARATADALSTLTKPDASTGRPPNPPGLFRIATPNRELATAAAAQIPAGAQVAIVRDNKKDPYNSGLADSFQKALQANNPRAAIVAPPSYDSTNPEGLGTSLNNTTVPAVCRSAATVVFVAGRGIDIEKFLIAVDDNAQCQTREQPLTVLAGDDGVDVLNQLRRAKSFGPDARPQERDAINRDLLEAFQNGSFVFRYTALAHPSGWNTPEFTASAKQFTDALAPFKPILGKDISLDEGAQIMGYDATIVAVRCIRQSVVDGDLDVMPADVLKACSAFSPQNPIYGASGALGFDAGQATGKTVPIVEVQPDGKAPVNSYYPRAR